MNSIQTQKRGAKRIGISLVLFGFALTVRSLPWRLVFQEDGILPRGNDSFYHLRRIVYSVANFPQSLEFDRYIAYPDGARPIWTPVFDWLLALAALPFAPGSAAAGQGDVAAIERFAVWVPPVLGALCVVALFETTRRRFGTGMAFSAALILSLSSGHFWYSQLGFVDHHAAVALAAWIALAAAMRWLECEAATGVAAVGPVWRASLGAGLAFAAALLLWPGSLLHVGLIEVGLVVYLLTRSERLAAAGFALRFCAANGLAALVVAPMALGQDWPQWAPFSPVVLTEFQPWFFSVLAVFGALYFAIWRGQGASGAAPRWVSGVLLGVTLLVGSAVAFSGWEPGIADALRWMFRSESFQSQVTESVPILLSGEKIRFASAFVYLSWFALLFPVVVVVAVISEFRGGSRFGFPAGLPAGFPAGAGPPSASFGRARESILLLLWFAAGLFLATLAQRRFFNSLSLPMSLMMAWTLHAAYLWLRRPLGRIAAVAVLAVAAVVLLTPTYELFSRHFENEIRAWRGEAIENAPQVMNQVSAVKVANWIRLNTPPTAGWLDAGVQPEYAVLGPWSIGHKIEYIARRPSVTDGFGDDIGEESFELARLYYQLPERTAAKVLDRLGVRYVIVSARAVFLDAQPLPTSMYRALYQRDGSEASRVGRVPRHPALRRHRLVFETAGYLQGAPSDAPGFKVFEYVPGALLSGRTIPHGRVTATLELTTIRGRSIRYSTRASASGDGRYEIRVPYATVGGPPSTRVAEFYTVACDTAEVSAAVPESAVQAGANVEVPDLCLGSSPNSQGSSDS